jgi:hypothetical protein
MRKVLTFTYYYLESKLIDKIVINNKQDYISKHELIQGRATLSSGRINNIIAEKIISGKPFMAARFGAVELNAVRTFDFELKSKYKRTLSQMQMCAGFFPPEEEQGIKFKEIMLKSIPEADIMGIWLSSFEKYYLNKYGKKNIETTYLQDLQPWREPSNPWTAALKGKKVLVIHPFSETIEKQYEKREKIFEGTDILPEFKLKTLKAVQTIAGNRDERFETWFDALEWMYQEAMKIEFDVAIIGCGAYGYPLAAKIKQAGKQAIHLGGVTQLLFGIKGKRWEKNNSYVCLQKYINDAWIYPTDADRPEHAEKVEGGCYW